VSGHISGALFLSLRFINIFQDDVDAYMASEENGGDVDKVLRRLDEQHSKYKFMEYSLASKKRR
jgi:hypothetical protein